MSKAINIEKAFEDAAKNVVEETAKRIVDELKSNNMIKKEMSYYKRVELLLYNYENLKDAVKQNGKEENHYRNIRRTDSYWSSLCRNSILLSVCPAIPSEKDSLYLYRPRRHRRLHI